MVVCGYRTDGGLSAADGSDVGGMASAAFPDGGAFCLGAAGDIGAAAIRWFAPGASGGGHPEWDGDQGLFAGAVVCAAVGGTAE